MFDIKDIPEYNSSYGLSQLEVKMKSQKCKNCTYYTAYYKKWHANFGRLNNGFCTKHQKHQTQFETCENFKSSEQKEKMREERLFDSLEQSLKSINEISQILKEKFN